MNDRKLQTDTLRFYIDHPTSPFHQWNDGWRYWGDLGSAIKELDVYFRKSRVLAYTKEKWGSYRVSVLSLYDGTLKSWLQPSVRRNFDWWYYSSFLVGLSSRKDESGCFSWFVGSCAELVDTFIKKVVQPSVNWLLGKISRLDYFIARPHLPFYHEFHMKEEEYEHPMLHKVDKWIKDNVRFIPRRFIRWVQQRQTQKVNEGFQKVCLKYPHLVHELVSEIDCYEWIRPYGDYILDGKEIHDQHWTKL